MTITLRKCNWNDTPAHVVELMGEGGESPVCIKVWNANTRTPENIALAKAVARDIVARFNACDGLNTEVLEEGVKLKGLLDDAIKRLEAERLRDDALQALQYARTVIDTLSDKASSKADRDYCQRILADGNSIDAALAQNGEATAMITKMYFSASKKLEAERDKTAAASKDTEMLNWLLGRIAYNGVKDGIESWKMLPFDAPEWNFAERGLHDMRAIVAQAMGGAQ